MKYASTTTLTAIAATLLMANLPAPAHANNAGVEHILQNRPELSNFYQALISTGVINELNAGVPYTIFAPTNDAFARLTQAEYPCLYSPACKVEIADILRNHIVPGFETVDTGKGGFYSIDRRFIAIGESYRHQYTADGNDIINTRMFGGGTLYTLNGVIANAYELASLEAAPVTEQVTTTRTVDPGCNPIYGCPDSVSSTTTITRTTLTPAR